ncbi:CHAP domain-containing protein [Flavobacterium amniphilum]|uniref:CHAP domain-containing protein n=1 Tax=Flavobacterium amniphilum TaxID=1834035 RepID=UPI00202A69F8|nr:CHAP domain-containing protein [Flavobacterium amniphilum]MCL9805510.1 CHAP domain-containing protein [Flavobacterium amniphilum]
MKLKHLFFLSVIILLVFVATWSAKKINLNPNYNVGQKLDSLHGVHVYYNGGVDHTSERNLTSDNYNLGLKYQCVEFVKRYYYEHLNHKMPDAYGHAKDFFDAAVTDGQLNKKRDLTQYSNPSLSKPLVGDLVIFSPTILNRFGHVAIISNVKDDQIEIIQQNPGPFGTSRETYTLISENGKWNINNDRIMGWLRKENK